MLNGQQLESLIDMLGKYFSLADMIQLVKFKLDTTLEEVVGVSGQAKRDVFFALLEWLEHRGRTVVFLQAVLADRQIAELTQVCNSLLSSLGTVGTVQPVQPIDANKVTALVVEFRTAFKIRFEWVKCMNAYKRLHDALHDLGAMQSAIEQAAGQFKKDVNSSIQLQTLVDTLEDDLVAEAADANKETEEADDNRVWIDSFALAVKNLRASLTPPDFEKIEQAVAALKSLPQSQQAGLNEEILACARRLKAEELVALMDGVITGLGQIPNATDLQASMTRFRTLCQQLGGFIADHNACQKVDTSFGAVVDASQATADRVFQWPNLLAALLRISARRPNDPKAKRVGEYARAFDQAVDAKSAATSFALLRPQFQRMFMQTDKDLLEITTGLVNEATLLDSKLGRF